MTEFTIYKGDTFLFIGTADYCAKIMGIKPASIKFMATPAAKKRFENRKDKSKALTAVKLEDEEK